MQPKEAVKRAAARGRDGGAPGRQYLPDLAPRGFQPPGPGKEVA
jgi:hypothetical protein